MGHNGASEDLSDYFGLSYEKVAPSLGVQQQIKFQQEILLFTLRSMLVQRRRTRQPHDEEPEGQPELRRRRVHNAEGDRPTQSTEDRADQCAIHHGGKTYVISLTASAGKCTAPTRQLALKRVRLVLGDLSAVIAPGEAAPTRTPLAEILAPRRAHHRRRTAAKRKADELEQIENRPSGLVNRTVRDAARAEAFAWDVNGREFWFLSCCEARGLMAEPSPTSSGGGSLCFGK